MSAAAGRRCLLVVLALVQGWPTRRCPLLGDLGEIKSFGPPLPIPVIQLLSDLEAVDDGVDPATLDPNHRRWEVAGTSHSDLFIGYQSIVGDGPRSMVDAAPVSAARFQEIIDTAGNDGERIDPLLAGCIAAGATMPMHYAASTAIHELAAWVGGGAPIAHGPRFEFAGGSWPRCSRAARRVGLADATRPRRRARIREIRLHRGPASACPRRRVDQAVHGSRGGSRRSELHAVGGPARYVDTGVDASTIGR